MFRVGWNVDDDSEFDIGVMSGTVGYRSDG